VKFGLDCGILLSREAWEGGGKFVVGEAVLWKRKRQETTPQTAGQSCRPKYRSLGWQDKKVGA
jgi:hypothetical protein